MQEKVTETSRRTGARTESLPHAKSPSLKDAVCLACGCLCDDIVLRLKGNRIVEAERACPIGRRWFTTAGATDYEPSCRVDGKPAELAAGYDRAAEMLAAARCPLVLGLAGATCEAIRVAVSLADRLGACIDPADDGTAALTRAVQSSGIVTATLGEVRHRADLVIFWHVDPATTHPRHFERYSLSCAGRFVPRGRADRFCVVVDERQTATAAEADQFLQIEPGGDAPSLAALRALAAGDELDAVAVEHETGVPLAKWQALVDRAKAARYTAVFFDPGRKVLDRPAALASLLKLAHDMNSKTRFVVVPLGSAGNANGAEQVLTWQTGYPAAVSFADGCPQFDPERHSAEAMLSGGGADAALVVDAAAADALSVAARAHLATIPKFVLTTEAVDTASTAAVAFRVAVPGIHTRGTVFRADGVPLALRPAISSPHPSAESVLTEIGNRI